MNLNHLNQIAQNYIEKFEYINNEEHQENYKWAAVKKFRDVFDLDAENFPEMLKKARAATDNMIDSRMQPFGGLVTLAEKKGEAETIRQMFRDLYADDGGDLEKRQQKIQNFLTSCDGLLSKHYPESFRFKNDQRSAMAYLWFHDPDHNYLCKTTEARYMADAVEFYDDWGTYSDFKLAAYYRFCDELVGALQQIPQLMKTHESRFIGHEEDMDPDRACHILVFDLIYCAETYGLYTGVKVKQLSGQEKKLLEEKKEKARSLAEKLSLAEQQFQMLKDANAVLKDWVEKKVPVRHKMFGEGAVTSSCEMQDQLYVGVVFPQKNTEKKFVLTQMISSGMLELETEEFTAFVSEYREVLQKAGTITGQLKNARKALEPYKEYLE